MDPISNTHTHGTTAISMCESHPASLSSSTGKIGHPHDDHDHHHHAFITPMSSISLLWKQQRQPRSILLNTTASSSNYHTNSNDLAHHVGNSNITPANNNTTTSSSFVTTTPTGSVEASPPPSSSSVIQSYQLKTKRNRVVTKVIQHPTMFYNFHAFCKHLSEVWEMVDLVDLYKEYIKTKQLGTHPAIVSAFIAYTYKLPPIESKCFLFDVWNDILRSWNNLPPICHIIVWSRLQEIVDAYYRHRLNYVMAQSILAPFVPTNRVIQQHCRAFSSGTDIIDSETGNAPDAKEASSPISESVRNKIHTHEAKQHTNTSDDDSDDSASSSSSEYDDDETDDIHRNRTYCHFYSPITTLDSIELCADDTNTVLSSSS